MGADSGVCVASSVDGLSEAGFTGFKDLQDWKPLLQEVFSFSVDASVGRWYGNKKISVEVMDLSTTNYSNRKALDEALQFYLDAMSQFVISNLSEQLIKDDLPQLSGPDIRTDMEIKDIAFLIRRHWEFSFRKEF